MKDYRVYCTISIDQVIVFPDVSRNWKCVVEAMPISAASRMLACYHNVSDLGVQADLMEIGHVGGQRRRIIRCRQWSSGQICDIIALWMEKRCRTLARGKIENDG
jgi:hypothetical protein